MSENSVEYPDGFAELFEPTFVEYANADIQGTLTTAPPALIHRVHLIASVAPGLVTVCASVEGWRFLPGGRLELRETMSDAIERELREEAGSVPTGAPREFFSHIATSRDATGYKPHVPHPVMWWTYALTDSRVIGAPTCPADGEQITEVHHLPVDAATAWLAEDESGRTHADVLRLASRLRLV